MDNKKSAANSGVKDNLTEVKVTNEEVLASKKQPRQQRKQQLRQPVQRKNNS